MPRDDYDSRVPDDDAVSPVIGVVLMVAITVILAAITGAFVLEVGQGPDTTPQTSFDFEWDAGTDSLTVTHAGGDTLDDENTGELRITSSGGTVDQQWSLAVSAGDSETVTAAALPGETVRVVWTAPGGEESYVLGSFDVPA